MTKYFLSKISIFVALLTVFASCTKVDDTLGQDFIPKNEMLSIDVTSDFQINTYNVSTDSVVSDFRSSNYLGSCVDPVTGSITADLLFQMAIPYFGETKNVYFGKDPVIDSVFLVLYVGGIKGKSDVDQTFDLYELTKPIYMDSTYYTDFDPTGFYNTTPMLSFDYSGRKQYINKQIVDPQFIARLTDDANFSSDDVFHSRFKGFYLKTRTPKTDAAVYNIILSESSVLAYYHNGSDTTIRSASFNLGPNTSNFAGNNQSINVIRHDYSTASADLRVDDKTTPASRNFIQGCGGLSTYMEFSKESVNKLKKSVKDKGYSDIIINKAKLAVNFPTRDPVVMDQAFQRLGIYTKPISATGIPDYNYTLEQTYGYSIPYGGYINRSQYKYEMDVTMYVQRLFRDEYDVRGVTLAPSIGEYFTMNNIELSGSASTNPMKLTITYTMVK